ncbi:MAG: aromatic amino acid ammonia-lyase [Candidatus Falkowbacteria bacterium]|nr:aromatic amino acid ammonia-lyase [Candidatus Falkowbacteria bacterium]
MKKLNIEIIINGHSLTLEEVILAARGYEDGNGDHHYPVITLSDDAKKTIGAKRTELEKRIEAGDVIYGVNTGCGINKGTILPTEVIDDYQRYYIPAHCVQFGAYFPEEVVRATMILRVNSFATGYSAMRLETCEKILEFYNQGIIPCVPEQGSVGSSGDLAPLAHVAAALTGLPDQRVYISEGDPQTRLGPMPVLEALDKKGVKPIVLRAKEAMGLTNGATFTLALGLLTIHDAERLFHFSDLAAALSLEAIRGEKAAFDPRLIGIRNHAGAVRTAKIIRNLIFGSKRMTQKAQNICLPAEEGIKKYDKQGKPVPRVQDAYSFRAYPPVAGCAHDAFLYAKKAFVDEINAATDNPLLFEKEDGPGFEALSGGNFHGEPLGQALDFLKIALQQIANISDRRFYALTMPSTSYGLPANLGGQTERDLNTGFMIQQYSTAAAVSENKILCHPSVVDSIPTSANQEDYVSMSATASRHAARVLYNTRFVIASEILAAAQGISLTEADLAKEDCASLGEKTGRAYEIIRQQISAMDDDRMLCVDVDKMIELMEGDELLSVTQ